MMSIWCAVRGFVAQGLTAVVGKEVVVNAFAAAEAFVEPLLEAVSEDFMDYAIFEKEVTESPRYVGVV